MAPNDEYISNKYSNSIISSSLDDYNLRRYHKQETPSEVVDRLLDRAYSDLPHFLKSFVPLISWIPKYNRIWLIGDLISGFTLGVMLVPQSIAYSKLAQIPVEHGLYSSFIGNLIYTLFGGSREIAVGPNAVLSLLIGSAVSSVLAMPDNIYTAAQVGSVLSIIFAFISLGLGVFKLGLILDLIPSPVILGFTTGAASTIMLSQLSSMLGIPNVVNTKATWLIIYDIFANIPQIRFRDLLFGLSSLLLLFLIPFAVSYGNKKYPMLNYFVIGSNAIAVIVFTLISLGIKMSDPNIPLNIIGNVPQGFGYIGVPSTSLDLWQSVISYAPGIFLVAILEHTAVCKNFSSKIGYQVSTSQEFFAVGMCNIVASFFSGFPVAGSLSRGAVLSKSGVRTPFVGIFIAIILLAALEFLTPAFYYIPSATLGAIIMKAGISLIPSYSSMKELYSTSKIDFFVFVVAAIITFFFGVQYGIGSAVGISFIYLLLRIARPKFYVLGEVVGREGVFVDKYHPGYTTMDPEPGVIVFRIQESIIFPNISFLKDQLMDHVLEFTKSAAPPVLSKDKLWSSDMLDRAKHLRSMRAKRLRRPLPNEDEIPYLRAVILDLGAVNYIDASGIQGLKELKEQLYLYAGCHPSQLSSLDIEDAFEERERFEIHYVSIHLKVLRSLVLSGLPSSLSPTYSIPQKSEVSLKKPSVSIPLSNISSHNNLSNQTNPNSSHEETHENAEHNVPLLETAEGLARSIFELEDDVEPIVLNSCKNIHITLHGAIKKIRSNIRKSNEID